MRRNRRTLCQRSDGQPKRRYRTRTLAWDAGRRLVDQGLALDGSLKAYQCPECEWFHVGRPRRVLGILRQENARRRNGGAWR